MSISDHFSLPYIGMKDGFHSYLFVAENDFFTKFENSSVTDGTVNIKIDVDKRPGLSDLTIEINGHVSAVCDRCLADINLPISGTYEILVKVSSTEADDIDVIYIKEDEPFLLLDQLIYEYICLSVPLIKKYDCESNIPKPCDEQILAKLNASSSKAIETDEELNIWNTLKDINLDN